jgi:hypothetical protein
MGPTLRLAGAVDRDALIAAIEEHHVVALRYGRRPEPRHLLPHVLYLTSTGRPMLDAYQLSGPTTSGPLPGWREFALERIVRLEVLEERFLPVPDYHPESPRYEHGVVAMA